MNSLAFIQEVKFIPDNFSNFLPINISDGYAGSATQIVSLEEKEEANHVKLEKSEIQYFDKVQLQTIHKFKNYGHWSIFSGLDASGQPHVVLVYKKTVVEVIKT